MTGSTVNIVAVCKGDDKYILLFDDEHCGEAVSQAGRWAANPELTFTWYDAACAARKIRKVLDERDSNGTDVNGPCQPY